MPLLLCPNDNSSMRTVQRSGVEFDMCPTCRGVWLDRGELEKLIAAAQADDMPSAAPPPRTGNPGFLPRSAPTSDRRYERRDDDDDDDDRAHGGRRKSRGSSFFDIFD